VALAGFWWASRPWWGEAPKRPNRIRKGFLFVPPVGRAGLMRSPSRALDVFDPKILSYLF